MAIALGQHRSIDAGVATSTNLAYSSNVAANDLLVVVVRSGGTTGLPFTVSDTQGNTWTGLTSNTVTNIGSLQIFWAVAKSSSANTVTASISGSATTLRIAIFEYSGTATASPVDAENNSSTSTGTSTNAVSIVPGANGELAIAAIATASANTVSAGANYTLEEAVPAAPNSKLGVEDWIQTTAASTNGPATLSVSDQWMEALAVFKAAGGGGGASVSLLPIMGCGT